MKKFLVVIMVLVLATSFAFAQDIDTKKADWGLRTGMPFGIAGRFHLDGAKSLEFIAGISGGSIINLTGLYEWHKPIGEIENLSWYYGGGVHVGVLPLNLGVDGVVGIEYDLESLISFPLSISADYKPAINFFSFITSDLSNASLTFRYTFGKR